jgi:ABC-type glycerol-3-phosphate transport system permease component
LSKHLTIWFVLIVAFVPVYLMIAVSFKDNTQFYSAPVAIARPLHIENWALAWDTIRDSVGNTIYAAVTATAFTLVFALASAYFFARLKLPLAGLLWNALLILMMYPAIASLVPLYRLLGTMGLLNTLTAIVIVWVATGQAASIFVLRTFVADVPRDLFEAAEIDGAGHFRQMWSVVRPLSGPILGTVGIMVFVGFWNDFILPLVVLRDNEKLTIMVQLMRMSGEYIKYWGPMMAGYALASVPVIVLFVLSMRLFVRGISEGALKT